MAILLDENTNVLIQGITGREGQLRCRLALNYGTNVVAGVTPGKGGQDVYGVPVYDTVVEAFEKHGPIDFSALFVPAPFTKSAALEAIDAGVKTLLLVADRLPHQDAMQIFAYAKRRNARAIGPNSIGIISPGKAQIGIIGGAMELARVTFKPGSIGVISRSGGQTTTICYLLTQRGYGQTTAIGVGGDSIVGSTFAELLPLFEEDEETEAVVMFGEIGTVAEEEAAEVIKEGKYTKPVVAYIAGAKAKPGTRFSHAGAIVERGRGTAESKIRAMKEAGVYVADLWSEILSKVEQALKEVRR